MRAPRSKAQSHVSSSAEEVMSSLLGSAVIRRVDLVLIINQIFDEEYDPINVSRRVKYHHSQRTFDFKADNLGVQTECADRIF